MQHIPIPRGRLLPQPPNLSRHVYYAYRLFATLVQHIPRLVVHVYGGHLLRAYLIRKPGPGLSQTGALHGLYSGDLAFE